MRIKLVILKKDEKSIRILFDTSEERLLDVYQLYTSPLKQEISFLLRVIKLRLMRPHVFCLNY